MNDQSRKLSSIVTRALPQLLPTDHTYPPSMSKACNAARTKTAYWIRGLNWKGLAVPKKWGRDNKNGEIGNFKEHTG